MKDKEEKAPDIKPDVKLQVYVYSAGICSFYGCTKFVLEETLTRKKNKLGHIAHIVGETTGVKSPRGNDPLPLSDRSKFENLMLMCTEHHGMIDKKENWLFYSVEKLRKWKKDHEKRMRRITKIPVTSISHRLRFVGQIRKAPFTIPDLEMDSAVSNYEKRYTGETIFDIDLNNIEDSGSAYWDTGKAKIDKILAEEVFPKIERKEVSRLSIFALARIPLLAYLGFRLGDKVVATLYQKHKKKGEEWSWPKIKKEINFEVIQHNGKKNETVGLLVSISGGRIDKVKQVMGENLIYEIRPIGDIPKLTLLSSPQTLENFRQIYRDLLSKIESDHSTIKQIDYFLAVPAPIAIICGREIRPEVPKVIIYDLDDNDEYQQAITLKK